MIGRRRWMLMEGWLFLAPTRLYGDIWTWRNLPSASTCISCVGPKLQDDLTPTSHPSSHLTTTSRRSCIQRTTRSADHRPKAFQSNDTTSVLDMISRQPTMDLGLDILP